MNNKTPLPPTAKDTPGTDGATIRMSKSWVALIDSNLAEHGCNAFGGGAEIVHRFNTQPLLIDAALDVEAAGRPHSKDCECEQCESWDKLVRVLAEVAPEAQS